MKKIVILIILLLLAGTIFYFGWIKIPENSYGVFFSTITGYENKIFETGKFHWRWQKVIPKSSKLYIISSVPRKADLPVRGTLPSGAAYSSSLPGNPDFAYSVTITSVYSLDENFILDSVINRGSEFLPDSGEYEAVYKDLEKQMQAVLQNHIEQEFLASIDKTGSNAEIEKSIFSSDVLQQIIEEKVRGVNLIELNVLTRSFPDINLYKTAINHYRQISEENRKHAVESAVKTAGSEADLQKRLDALERYGELLTKYPILLEYLKINPDSDILKEGAKLEARR